MVRRKTREDGSSPLPGYADLQEIGGGAFATVFKAVEVDTGRPVALKILKVDTIHARLIETFHHEIQALAAVSDHPNIVTLYRPSNTTDGRPVLVLELCRESLGQQLRTGGPIAPADVTRIGIKIAGALETAHRNGFLHRDMKPQNILVTQFGEPALADFGVAALQASAQLTAGVFGFTTLHAAPEMLEGHHLSPATDIYGLASTMYQLLTGQAPFASYDNEAPASVILRILRDPVRPLRAEHIPLYLADLLEAALSKEPEGRPRSALEFAQALQRMEAAQGWPETTFVAWGQEGRQPVPLVSARGPMGVVIDTARPDPGDPLLAPAGGAARSDSTGLRSGPDPHLFSSPGIVMPAPERRDTAPPARLGLLGAPAGPGPSGASGSGGPGGPGGSRGGGSLPPLLPSVGSGPGAGPAGRPEGRDPSAPLPSPARPGPPSLVAPSGGARNVIGSAEAVQGRGAPSPGENRPGEVGGTGGEPPVGDGPPVGGGPFESTGPPPWQPPPVPEPGPGASVSSGGAPAADPSDAPPFIPPPPPPMHVRPATPGERPPPPESLPRPTYLRPSSGEPARPGSSLPAPITAADRSSPSPPSPPTFVDPAPSDRLDTTSTYEQTMGVPQLGPRPYVPAPPAPRTGEANGAGRMAAMPMWAVGGLVIAVLVAVAAVLLVAGVL